MANAFEPIEMTRSRLLNIIQELIPLAQSYARPPPGAFRAEEALIIKANELIAVAQTPVDKVTSLVSTTLETSVLRALLKLNIIQSIPESGSIALSSLAKVTDVQPSLVERLLRMSVASKFLLQDNRTGEYSHTHLSSEFADSDSISTSMFSRFCDDNLASLLPLHAYLSQQREAVGRWEEPGASRDSTRFNLETWRAGVEGEKTAFEVMESDPVRMAAFQKMMKVGEFMNPYVGYYDFSRLVTGDNGRKVLVDVGGGQGFALKAILEHHTDISPSQCVLQDTARVVSLAQTSNPAGLPRGVTYSPHDFFTPQPIRGARAYYLKAIAHDLSDSNLVIVLTHIAKAMAPDSKVLIAENVVPEIGCSTWLSLSDLFMMGIGGKERTENGFRDVLERSGLEVEGVWKVGGGSSYAILEARSKGVRSE